MIVNERVKNAVDEELEDIERSIEEYEYSGIDNTTNILIKSNDKYINALMQ